MKKEESIEIVDPIQQLKEKAFLISGRCSFDKIQELQRFIFRNGVGLFGTGLMYEISTPYTSISDGWEAADFTFMVQKGPSYKLLAELSAICKSYSDQKFTVEKYKP